MWLADDVVKDDRTGKVNVSGLFDTIHVAPPSNEFGRPAYLFFAISGAHAPVSLRLCYVDLADNRVLIERPVQVSSSGPLEIIDVAVRLKKMPIPRPGLYAWELYAENELLGRSRVRAISVQ